MQTTRYDLGALAPLSSLLLVLATACPGSGEEGSASASSTETSSGDGDGDATGDGDGDGDATGDGDGDATGDGDGDATGDGDGDSGTSDGWGDEPPGGDCEADEPPAITSDDDPTLDCASEAVWPYEGPVCGPDELPCVLEADVELGAAPLGVTSGPPSIALGDDCRPQVLYAIASDCFAGYHVSYDGSWLSEKMPMVMALGLLAIEPATHIATAVIADGALQPSAWTRDPSWAHVATAPEPGLIGQGLVRALDGTLHTSYEVSDDALPSSWVHARFDGELWTSAPLEQHGGRLEVAVSVAGEPHFVGWSSVGGEGWHLRWQTAQTNLEEVIPLGSNVLEWDRIGMVTTGGDPQTPVGTPHILHALSSGSELSPIDLAYSTRVSVDDWTTVIVAQAETAQPCAQPPLGPDETCDYDYVRVYPLDIVASESGAVRMLWTRTQHTGTYSAECVDFPEQECFWTDAVGSTSSELWISWPEGGDVSSAMLLPSHAVWGQAALDPGGRIHLATYDREDDARSFRYRRLAP